MEALLFLHVQEDLGHGAVRCCAVGPPVGALPSSDLAGDLVILLLVQQHAIHGEVVGHLKLPRAHRDGEIYGSAA